MDVNKIDDDGDSVILKGLKFYCDSAVGFLIQKNADLEIRDKNGFSVMDLIFVKGNKDLIKRVQRKMNKSKFEKIINYYDEKKINFLKEKLKKFGICVFKEEKSICNLKRLSDNQKTDDSFYSQKKNSFLKKKKKKGKNF